MSVYPELVTGRLDEFPARPWSVRAGSTARGGASCDLVRYEIEVPLGGGEVERVVRAHELMHVRVSPRDVSFVRAMGDVSTRALECAEEFRVNSLLARLGFDVGLLRDGSEKPGAQRLAQADRWDEAVCFLLAVLGTGAEREYLSGIRRERPEWMKGLGAVRRRALSLAGAESAASMGATDLDESGVPRGYARVTLALARLVSQAMSARVPVGEEELRSFRRSLAPGGRRAPTGRFAPLVLACGDLHARTRRASRRRRRPASTGTVLVRPGRLLTDERRAAFARLDRARGGVVVVDQSGSMNVDPDELARLVVEWPDCVVVGYSHRPGDLGSVPNAWVLARDGRVANEPCVGNVGNGVDGPALEWALSQRSPGEVVVWVSDGQVTDSHDHPSAELARAVADLVVRHRVRLVRELGLVARALAAGRWTNEWAAFGRIGASVLVRG